MKGSGFSPVALPPTPCSFPAGASVMGNELLSERSSGEKFWCSHFLRAKGINQENKTHTHTPLDVTHFSLSRPIQGN